MDPHEGAEMADGVEVRVSEQGQSVVCMVAKLFGRAQNTNVVADATCASKGHDSAHPLDEKDLGSRGVRELVESTSKCGDSGGRVDHVTRKASVPPSEATRRILSCSAVDKYPHLPTSGQSPPQGVQYPVFFCVGNNRE